jgi:glycosyltransferase involved in cell wall biosynthesis
MSKKILHVCPYLHPRAGGPAILVLNYSRLLPQHGWQASILTTDWYSPGGPEEIRRTFAKDLDVMVLATGSNRLRIFQKDHNQAAQEAFSKADIFHVHGLWHPLGLMVRRYALAHGKPYVISTHGMLDPWSMQQGQLRKLIYFQLIEKQNLHHAARIIFTTEEERRHITHLQVADLRTDIVLLGANDPPEIDREESRKRFFGRYPALRNRKIILFFGRLHEKKGLHFILEFLPQILKQVPGALLLVVGDGDETYVNEIKKQIADLHLEDNVLLTGR